MDATELQFVVREDETGGYHAHCHLPGTDIVTEGNSLDELRANIEEVILLYLEQLAADSGESAVSEARYTLIFADPVRNPA